MSISNKIVDITDKIVDTPSVLVVIIILFIVKLCVICSMVQASQKIKSNLSH